MNFFFVFCMLSVLIRDVILERGGSLALPLFACLIISPLGEIFGEAVLDHNDWYFEG